MWSKIKRFWKDNQLPLLSKLSLATLDSIFYGIYLPISVLALIFGWASLLGVNLFTLLASCVPPVALFIGCSVIISAFIYMSIKLTVGNEVKLHHDLSNAKINNRKIRAELDIESKPNKKLTQQKQITPPVNMPKNSVNKINAFFKGLSGLKNGNRVMHALSLFLIATGFITFNPWFILVSLGAGLTYLSISVARVYLNHSDKTKIDVLKKETTILENAKHKSELSKKNAKIKLLKEQLAEEKANCASLKDKNQSLEKQLNDKNNKIDSKNDSIVNNPQSFFFKRKHENTTKEESLRDEKNTLNALQNAISQCSRRPD